jgi:hypothetical protein
LGFQTIYQSALNFGGNEDPAKPILKKMVNPTGGRKFGWQNKEVEVTLNTIE